MHFSTLAHAELMRAAQLPEDTAEYVNSLGQKVMQLESELMAANRRVHALQ